MPIYIFLPPLSSYISTYLCTYIYPPTYLYLPPLLSYLSIYLYLTVSSSYHLIFLSLRFYLYLPLILLAIYTLSSRSSVSYCLLLSIYTILSLPSIPLYLSIPVYLYHTISSSYPSILVSSYHSIYLSPLSFYSILSLHIPIYHIVSFPYPPIILAIILAILLLFLYTILSLPSVSSYTILSSLPKVSLLIVYSYCGTVM